MNSDAYILSPQLAQILDVKNYPADLGHSNFIVDLSQSASLFSVVGPDAERYLHARTTQDVKSLAVGNSAKSICLTPQGKITGIFTIFRRDKDSFLLVFHGNQDKIFLEELMRFKVADRFECQRIDSALILFHTTQLKQKDLISIPIFAGDQESRISISLNCDSSLIKDFSLQPIELFHFVRIAHTTPWFDDDIGDKTMATEIPFQEYISFSKGCYAGQEMVEMSIARGRPNYKLVKLIGSAKSSPKPQDKLFEPATAKQCGFITSTIINQANNSFAALGFIKTSLQDSQQLLLNGETVDVSE